jgi:diaminopimelate decarboxylase
VEYQKINEGKHFTVVDAAMNDLLRPSLYGAWQEIVEVQQPTPYNPIETDIVGPVCETGDFLGKQRRIDATEGSLLAIMSAGAYGFAMSSNYNTRARAAEVLVENDRVFLVRERETFEHLIAGEHLI